LRTNIVDVFDAIALDNAYPADHFSDDSWNQMVLKCLFIDRPLHRIVRFDERVNESLAAALSNLSHERWAAGRPVSPELWRGCVGCLDDQIVADLERVADSENSAQRQAFALVAAEDKSGRLDHLADRATEYRESIEQGLLTWKSLGESLG
ncbi:MAG: EboA domain-containing protein, partial [Verrucomicrobiota bacterium]